MTDLALYFLHRRLDVTNDKRQGAEMTDQRLPTQPRGSLHEHRCPLFGKLLLDEYSDKPYNTRPPRRPRPAAARGGRCKIAQLYGRRTAGDRKRGTWGNLGLRHLSFPLRTEIVVGLNQMCISN